MQTLDTNAVIVPEGYFLSAVTLTKAGREKVEDVFHYPYRGGWAKEQGISDWNSDLYFENVGSVEDWFDDIESDALAGEMHPVCKIQNDFVKLVQGIDYFFEFKSWQVWELEQIAKGLNELHEVMQEEMNRLGW